MRDSGHVDRYKNLRVKYIDHHNPDLVLLDKHGQETHRVDLTRLSSTHSIHKLCQLLGLKEICRDGTRVRLGGQRRVRAQQGLARASYATRATCAARPRRWRSWRARTPTRRMPYWATMGSASQPG